MELPLLFSFLVSLSLSLSLFLQRARASLLKSVSPGKLRKKNPTTRQLLEAEADFSKIRKYERRAGLFLHGEIHAGAPPPSCRSIYEHGRSLRISLVSLVSRRALFLSVLVPVGKQITNDPSSPSSYVTRRHPRKC